MRLAKVFLIVINFSFLVCVGNGKFFFLSSISKDRLSSEFVTSATRQSYINELILSMECEKYAWCSAACLLPNGETILTDLVVSGGITDTKPGTKIKCWTIRPPGIFPSPEATLSGSVHDSYYPNRILGNLADGVYERSWDGCYSTKKIITVYQFVLIELEKPQIIHKVVVRTQPDAKYMSERYGNFEVRVGNKAPTGTDMSSLTLIGSFDGPLTSDDVDKDLTFTLENPTRAKYISLQEMIASYRIIICHLEVF